MGACLGHPALVATVLRISLRYRRLAQLEEGYGVIVAPLERLARTVYADDPAECFRTKGTGLRDDLLMARMQKAAAVLQFKLEGQTIRRRPEWRLEHRNLLHRINRDEGTVEIDGRTHKLLDTHLPTLDPADPYALSTEEQACMNRLRQSFVSSSTLWHHMLAVVRHGAMWLRRDEALIFHGCVPVDEEGVETKNPYFRLIQDAEFCKRIARDFAAGDDALIVNGHVPVRIERGEEPVKRGGHAVTIDGAFSEAYGDRGYTLILAPERIALAEHHHFESISDAITEGADIVPKVTTLRAYDPPRRVADTEEGEHLRALVAALEKLADAYEQGLLLEDSGPPH
jgi:fructose-1,6-bisphosphatase